MPSAASLCSLCSVGVATEIDERRNLRVCLSCQHGDVSQTFSLKRLKDLWAMDHDKVVWRHDVDFDPLCAALMAEHEADAGVMGTYYIRLRGPYNVFDADVAYRIETILDAGHRIGLHHDTGLPRSVVIDEGHLREIRSDIIADWGILRREFPDILKLALPKFPVSFHAPPKDLRWRTWDLFEVADSAVWEGHYIADSRGVWRDSPEARLKTREPLMVNCHPEWWFLDEPDRIRLRNQEATKP